MFACESCNCYTCKCLIWMCTCTRSVQAPKKHKLDSSEYETDARLFVLSETDYTCSLFSCSHARVYTLTNFVLISSGVDLFTAANDIGATPSLPFSAHTRVCSCHSFLPVDSFHKATPQFIHSNSLSVTVHSRRSLEYFQTPHG